MFLNLIPFADLWTQSYRTFPCNNSNEPLCCLRITAQCPLKTLNKAFRLTGGILVFQAVLYNYFRL